MANEMGSKNHPRRLVYIRPTHYGTWSWVILSLFLVVLGTIVSTSQAATSTLAKATSSSLAIQIIVGIIGVLVVGIVAAVCWRRRRKRV